MEKKNARYELFTSTEITVRKLNEKRKLYLIRMGMQ